MTNQQPLQGALHNSLYSSGNDNGSRSRQSKWKLWTEMSPSEQDVALEEVFARAKPYGTMLGKKVHWKSEVSQTFHQNCTDGKRPTMFGEGGEHMACGPKPDPCKFISFGIRDDPSFDIQFSESWNCRGFAGDPSITHPSKLSPAVTFHNIGLKLLRPNIEQKRDPADEWILASLPSIRQFLGWDYVDLIKIDCEGCEVAMARDILLEDPSFLNNIGQISIETHATKTWVNGTEELYYYALMFALLEDAGLKLIWSDKFGCGKYERDGCMPEMEKKMNMSCGYAEYRGKPELNKNKIPNGWSCHDWLWARV
eukprot:CAMPEP_0194138098 /NCGR_PEP_ID=MMETSP0152-20130528/7947_1 /TAXON_ID=1049557 /ORGANISM="Thalassiothrix antarctica, Strain L6-D1" /LENGTH=310 /DNA_ID=CAMNT_0038835431 /DNA_START=134 /DNA_END=1066 /DNA_ORIENTATION=-